ncbi:MAG: hypothetical protein ACK5SX_08200 [Sandaracinobacter sp.]
MLMTNSPNSTTTAGPSDAPTDAGNGQLRVQYADRVPDAPEVSHAPFYVSVVPSPSEVDPGAEYPSLDEGALRASLRGDVPAPPAPSVSLALNLPDDAFKLSMLSPAEQEEVRAELATYPAHRREEAESELVRNKIAEKGSRFRTMRALAGPQASPYHQEVYSLTIEVERLQRQIDSHHEDMKAIRGYEPGPDGKPVPVYALSDAAMVARARLVNDLLRQQGLIAPGGPEAVRRLADAEERTVAMVKKLHAAARDEHDVRRMVDKIERDERINDRAAVRARMLKHGL